MTKKIAWVLFATLSILIGLYPLVYFVAENVGGLLNSKSEAILADTFWNIGFYCHISFGGIALLIGWIQFSKKMRATNIKLHRQIGKLYVIAALISGLAGLYIGFYATGGLVSVLGFISLAMVWLYSSSMAYLFAKSGEINRHEKMMYYSYAACFAAVTLRLWLPILLIAFGDFVTAYKIVAWLCWVPNLIVAYFLIGKLNSKEQAFAGG